MRISRVVKVKPLRSSSSANVATAAVNMLQYHQGRDKLGRLTWWRKTTATKAPWGAHNLTGRNHFHEQQQKAVRMLTRPDCHGTCDRQCPPPHIKRPQARLPRPTARFLSEQSPSHTSLSSCRTAQTAAKIVIEFALKPNSLAVCVSAGKQHSTSRSVTDQVTSAVAPHLAPKMLSGVSSAPATT